MKKRMTAFLAAILSPLFLMNYGCSKECGLALCDLITDVAISGTLTVVAGEPFSVPNLIDNLPESIESCKGDILQTLSAKVSESRMQIDFDLSDDGSYSKNESNGRFEVPEIPAGSTATENYTFSFDDIGEYRLITYADDTDVNEERNESNNASAPEYLASGRLNSPVKPPLIIKVLPNPNFKWKEGTPRVRLLSRTVTVK